MQSKVVFIDGKTTKVIRGKIIEDGKFLLQLKASDGSIISVGKRYIVQITPIEVQQ